MKEENNPEMKNDIDTEDAIPDNLLGSYFNTQNSIGNQEVGLANQRENWSNQPHIARNQETIATHQEESKANQHNHQNRVDHETNQQPILKSRLINQPGDTTTEGVLDNQHGMLHQRKIIQQHGQPTPQNHLESLPNHLPQSKPIEQQKLL